MPRVEIRTPVRHPLQPVQLPPLQLILVVYVLRQNPRKVDDVPPVHTLVFGAQSSICGRADDVGRAEVPVEDVRRGEVVQNLGNFPPTRVLVGDAQYT